MKQNLKHIKHPLYKVTPPGVMALCGDFGILTVAKEAHQVTCLRCKAKYERARKKAIKKQIKRKYGSISGAKKMRKLMKGESPNV